MQLTTKNIALFIAPLLIVFSLMFLMTDIDFFILLLNTVCAYGMIMLGWVLVDLFGD